MLNFVPRIFAFWDNDFMADFDLDSFGSQKFKTPEQEFLALQRAVELDGDWHRGVTSLLPAMVLDMTGDLCNGGRPVPVAPALLGSAAAATHFSPNKKSSSYRSPARHPCHQCGLVVEDYTYHIVNSCERFKDQGRYTWRRETIIHYLDSLIDQNNFRVFSDIPDRRTATGRTIPEDVLNPYSLSAESMVAANGDLTPAIFAIHKSSGDIYLFEVKTPHESEMEAAHRASMTDLLMPLKEVLRVQNGAGTRVHTFALEVGSSLGHMTESSKFTLWQFYQLTTKQVPMDSVVNNTAALTRLASYKIFRQRYDNRWNRRLRYLFPGERPSIWNAITFGSMMSRRKGHRRRRGLVRGYLVPLLKLLAALFVVSLGMFAVYLLCLALIWLWSMMTLKAAGIIGLVFLGCCLQLFRP